jgi:hypothetical protein
MRTTIIADEECLGTHDPKLAVGNTQTLVFGSEEVGPFYTTESARQDNRDNVGTGEYKKNESREGVS